ncbi:flagellar M-ring protein FliF [Nocardioides mangrovicus]|uniref:Flagellar M-ring protein n=1 Tax=Nocardioides mangrovicus TaxID=2478913 RepID=A0A3L8P012_9ACTN|nr:flagellar basal-body MS-ring/collar protein FliF [Nocardioides mangrovicus]RLV48780.1 flagellar M-ring protein FliF [Nocardioides mangrovicus]
MKDLVLGRLSGMQRTFSGFTAGQKVVALIGTGALLLGAVLVFRWVSQPDYAPLFSGLSDSDASAVVQQLDTEGVKYKIANGGDTVMVPRSEVYKTRIQLSGEGIPSGSDGGYSILDKQSLSTSEFQQQTDFKRAMEGELTKTIEAMDGVQTAVVHLAIPEKQVFSDKQGKPTASVLVQTRSGVTLNQNQVQAIVHLVAASIDGMKASDVTVADSKGQLLSNQSDTGAAGASSRNQYVESYQKQAEAKAQTLLNRVVGDGNADVQVTADLNFDKTTTQSRTYKQSDPNGLTLSSTKNTEDYTGAGGSTPTGVVGPDGQMDTSTTTTTTGSGSSASTYKKSSETSDSALDTTTQQVTSAPGSVQQLHVAVALDQTAAASTKPAEIQKMITSALGIDPARGDTLRVSVLPFDRSAEKSAAAELKASDAAAAKASKMSLYRNIGVGVLVLLGLLFLWLRGRKRAKQRAEQTTYVVEQLRNDAARREEAQRVVESPATQLLSLEAPDPTKDLQSELTQLVESQPDDVAALLRGWMADR